MEQIEKRVTEIENTLNLLMHHMQDVNHTIATGFEKIENNFIIVNRKIDSLRGNSASSLEIVENKLDDLKTEISKINDVTGYAEMIANHANLKIIKGS